MKKLWLYSIILVLSIGNLQAQDEELLNKVKSSFKTANAKMLSECFNNQVEISFDGEKATYNKTQSEIVLNDFFKKCTPKDFIIKHKGSSNEGLKYAISAYLCTSQNYRVYMLIKLQKGIYVIDTLDFNKEE